MTDSNEDFDLNAQDLSNFNFDVEVPLRTAGALPSSRTQDMLQAALDEEDIEQVKAQLKHVWGHYQSLEFILNSHELHANALRAVQAQNPDIDIATLAARYYASVVLDQAYENAHATLFLVQFGITVPQALRAIYKELDYSDPEREPVIDTEAV